MRIRAAAARALDAAEKAVVAPVGPVRGARKPRDSGAHAWSEIHRAAGRSRAKRIGANETEETRACPSCGGTGVARPRKARGTAAPSEPDRPEAEVFYPRCVRDGGTCPWRVEVQLFLAELGPEDREREIRTAFAAAVCADHRVANQVAARRDPLRARLGPAPRLSDAMIAWWAAQPVEEQAAEAARREALRLASAARRKERAEAAKAAAEAELQAQGVAS